MKEVTVNYVTKILGDRLLELGCKQTAYQVIVSHMRIKRKDFEDRSIETTSVWDYIATDHIKESMSQLEPKDVVMALKSSLDYVSETRAREEEEKQKKRKEGIEAITRIQKLCVDVRTGEMFLYNTKERCKSSWSVKALKSRFKEIEWDLYITDPPPPLVRMVFNPYKGLQRDWIAEDESMQVVHLNSYKPPEWYKRELTQEELAQPESYPRQFLWILEHLLPIKEEREMVLDWVAVAMFDRPLTYLSMRGTRETGKTVFKHILFHLIGNEFDVGRDVVADFAAELRGKRIVAADDNVKICSYEGYRIRKSILNPTMRMEEKFVQTTESEEQYLSLMILSNPGDPFYVEFDERRMLSPLMGKTKLREVCSYDELSFYSRMCRKDILDKDKDFIRQIGESMLRRYYQRRPSSDLQLKSGYFWSDVLQSLPSFKRFFLQSILFYPKNDKFTVQFEELKGTYKFEMGIGGKIPHWASFVGWLQSGFEYMGIPILHDGQGIDPHNRIVTPNQKLVGLHAK